jgi:hypothetical protein
MSLHICGEARHHELLDVQDESHPVTPPIELVPLSAEEAVDNHLSEKRQIHWRHSPAWRIDPACWQRFDRACWIATVLKVPNWSILPWIGEIMVMALEQALVCDVDKLERHGGAEERPGLPSISLLGLYASKAQIAGEIDADRIVARQNKWAKRENATIDNGVPTLAAFDSSVVTTRVAPAHAVAQQSLIRRGRQHAYSSQQPNELNQSISGPIAAIHPVAHAGGWIRSRINASTISRALGGKCSSSARPSATHR